jgi:hypothetical protein
MANVSVLPGATIWVLDGVITGSGGPLLSVMMVLPGPMATVNRRPCHAGPRSTTPPSWLVRLGFSCTPSAFQLNPE